MATTTSTAANKANGKTKSNSPSKDLSKAQHIIKIVTDNINQYFPTLAKMQCQYVIAAVMHNESSSFNPHSVGPALPADKGIVAKFYASQEAKNWLRQGGSITTACHDVQHAWGVMGVMGWQHIRWTFNGGLGAPDIIRHPLAAKFNLICDPSSSNTVSALYSGSNAETAGLIAGLIIFEANFKRAQQKLKQKRINNDGLALKMAVAMHLGGGVDLSTGISTNAYTEKAMTLASQWANGRPPFIVSSNTNYAALTNSSDVSVQLQGC